MLEELTGQGKVVGGDFMNGTVTTTSLKGDLVIQAGLRRRKLTPAQVGRWELVTAEKSNGDAIAGKVGRVVAGTVLPGFVGKAAGAALDATLGSGSIAPRTIRVEWVDGKQSLIRLPQKLFTHFALVHEKQQIEAVPAPEPEAASAEPVDRTDVVEQIGKLAALRDQGVLTEDEFASKKAELLGRL